ncbi:small heat shock protein, chloroplastic-like isoform X1 [Cornus florida]|uniref:small heat shock protein, chloroplastic-like isoform X1 n=1 Tax=Cornus florida TaxID=4283 RepID=UPI0028964B8E|nr:small heat shock protein, chloroplastic-like isoform X1 [Cornus florida]
MASSRSLTSASRLFAMSLRRLHQQRLTGFSPSAARYFCTSQYHNLDEYTKNPFGVANDANGGPRKVLWRRLLGEGLLVTRLDLPGLISEGLKVWVNESKDIVFEGKIKSEPDYEYEGGDQRGIISANQMMCDVEQFKAEVKHGVLWVTIPLNEDAKAVRKVQLDLMKKGLVKY